MEKAIVEKAKEAAKIYFATPVSYKGETAQLNVGVVDGKTLATFILFDNRGYLDEYEPKQDWEAWVEYTFHRFFREGDGGEAWEEFKDKISDIKARIQ
jgi:hypothetical protein